MHISARDTSSSENSYGHSALKQITWTSRNFLLCCPTSPVRWNLVLWHFFYWRLLPVNTPFSGVDTSSCNISPGADSLSGPVTVFPWGIFPPFSVQMLIATSNQLWCSMQILFSCLSNLKLWNKLRKKNLVHPYQRFFVSVHTNMSPWWNFLFYYQKRSIRGYAQLVSVAQLRWLNLKALLRCGDVCLVACQLFTCV